MVKPIPPREKLNWKDSNLALFGSELEKRIKAAAADGEPEWKRNDVGKKVQLHVWRIEKFLVKQWPKAKYGKFHKGDSYIVLNTYQPDPNKPKLAFDIYIWIGSESTQDEYGTAAYKMVELDDKLGGVAVQHRETQDNESQTFLDYFGGEVTYLEGGIESGFRHVEASAADPILYRVKGLRKSHTLRMTEMRVRRDSLNAGDVFILVAGEDAVWMWVGKQANVDEKSQGIQIARAFCKKGTVVVLDQGVNDSETEAADFWSHIPGDIPILGPIKWKLHIQPADNRDNQGKSFVPIVFRVPENVGGRLMRVRRARPVPVGPTKEMLPRIPNHILEPDHGYLLDTGFHVYVWLGAKTSPKTKANSIPLTHQYFRNRRRPNLPVTVLKEGQETTGFKDHFFDSSNEAQQDCVIL